MRIAYASGRYVPIHAAAVRIEDRGYQFADGVYEVVKAVHGEAVALERHFDRLERSLRELAIAMPCSRAALRRIVEEVLRRNRLRSAIVYIQVSRGVATRNHLFPKGGVRPSLIVTVRRAPFPDRHERGQGVGVITLPDERWKRCDIKSISLLPNVLAKQRAKDEGCREAWLVDDEGFVTEGCSSNAWIVDGEGVLTTRALGPEILGGITRSTILEIARCEGIPTSERSFSVDEARSAREAFLTSTSSLVLPVTEIDGAVIANGAPGSITSRLAAIYAERQGLSGILEPV